MEGNIAEGVSNHPHFFFLQADNCWSLLLAVTKVGCSRTRSALAHTIKTKNVRQCTRPHSDAQLYDVLSLLSYHKKKKNGTLAPPPPPRLPGPQMTAPVANNGRRLRAQPMSHFKLPQAADTSLDLSGVGTHFHTPRVLRLGFYFREN